MVKRKTLISITVFSVFLLTLLFIKFQFPFFIQFFKNSKEVMQTVASNNSTNPGRSHFKPLIRHSRKGNVRKVKSLLKKGKNPNMRGGGDFTPLMWAATLGQPEVARVLINAGANPYAKKGEFARTAFDYAVSGRPEIVKILMENGRDTYLRKHRNTDKRYLLQTVHGNDTEVLKIWPRSDP